MTAFLAAIVMGDTSSVHKPDTAPLSDSQRTIREITRTSFTLQYATTGQCETKIEFREGNRFAAIAHATANYRVTSPGASLTLWHSITVDNLKPGKRYFYRIYDPSAIPTSSEAEWGAAAPWSREFAVSTEAPAGRKTIIHLPVKVLLMPNVVNAESAIQADGSTAPDPPKITLNQLKLIEDEYKVASRVFWANSGMRLWVDFQFVVDDRWQRWGPAATGTSAFFQNLPVCRSYGNADYVDPGGGTFTFVDTKNPTRDSITPINDSFACQIEQAWPRRWDPVAKIWKFYVSGGGTLGVDDLPHGVPARTQFLAGGDTAWLAEHEFHHQLESLGAFCLGNSEDDRIVFDHPSPRHRNARGDGTYNEQAWTTTGPHGEQWDVMRYWDRQVTDCQWLRFGFGTTETVVDKNGDGFPDNDPRLPMDAKRFKSEVGLTSFESACNWDYVWLPLQPSWLKDWDSSTREVQKNGLAGTMSRTHIVRTGGGRLVIAHNSGYDENLLPILMPFHASIDADAKKWAPVIDAGTLVGNMSVTYKQGYDEAGYYGLIVAKGSVGHIDVDLDGEGKGMFTPPGAVGFTITNLKPAPGQAGPMVLPVSVKPTIGGVRGQMPWLKWKAVRHDDGTLIVEFKIPNGGDGPWYWQGAGHQIGVAINAYDTDGRGYSMGEPYRLYYSRMMESRGREARPAGPPPPLADSEVVLKPGDKRFTTRTGYQEVDGAFERIKGTASLLVAGQLKASDFDLTVTTEGSGDITFGGYADQTARPDPDRDYSLVMDGGKASLHVFGKPDDAESVHLGPGVHKLQLIRRSGGVWILVDGKVSGYARDPSPRVVVTKFGLFLPAGGDIVVRDVRYRLTSPLL